MIRKITTALLGATLSWGAWALELAAHPQVFSGPEGLQVTLAPSADGQQALLRVGGVNHPVDQVVFLGKLQKRGGGTEVYVTTLDGRDWTPVQRQQRYGSEQFVAYVPGRAQPQHLYYEADKSRALNTGELLAVYQQQRQAGVQDKLARFDRPKRVATLQEALQDTDRRATQACGSPVATTVSWQALTDDQLQRLSINGYCGEVAAQMGSMCAEQPAFKPQAARLGTIECRFGDALRLRAEGKGLVFTTREGAPNQKDFVHQFLRNQ
ncbi:MAG: hypothetical protein Q4G71_00515 [Pseudomonadota bacterium]|nr:hypothetical protein [Pseudomonadota bacterium]